MKELNFTPTCPTNDDETDNSYEVIYVFSQNYKKYAGGKKLHQELLQRVIYFCRSNCILPI